MPDWVARLKEKIGRRDIFIRAATILLLVTYLAQIEYGFSRAAPVGGDATRVFGIPFGVPFDARATLWLMAAALVVVYAAYARRATLAELHDGVEDTPVSQVALSGAPLWLTPLPWERAALGEDAANVLRRADALSRLNTVLFSAMCMIGLIVCLRVAQLDSDWAYLLDASAHGAAKLRYALHLTPILGLALVLSSWVAFLLSPFVARESPDPEERSWIDLSRRSTLYGLAATAAAAAFPLSVLQFLALRQPEDHRGTAGVRTRRRRVRKPGFKRQGPVLQTNFKSAFVFDTRGKKRAKRLHYADANGRIFGLDKHTRIGSFRIYDPGKDGEIGLSKFRLGLVAEKAALEIFHIDATGAIAPTRAQCEQACTTLLNAIGAGASSSAGKPEYRLFDLTAGLAYRYALPEALTKLVALGRRTPPDAVLAARLKAYAAALDDLKGTKSIVGNKHLRLMTRWNKRIAQVAWGTFALNETAPMEKRMRAIRFLAMV